ncbi:MAG: SDR family NAD(P)-dependent oxidoreductase [Clostridia bacterium]|nr:SDR family NAD(P)-dependent oxidoreductase [Clostridia bacterium]
MKNILITGAAGGLGIALVNEYLSRGFRIFAADIVPEEEALSRLPDEKDRLFYLPTDVTDTGAVDALARFVSARTDSLDIIISAAGIIRPESEDLLEDFDIDGSIRLFDVNALGPLRIAKAMIGLLRAGKDKVLVNISSEAGSMTSHADYIMRYDYCMSKAALNIQSVILQRYLKPEGIRVLLINPGWMHTPMGGPDAPVDPADSARGIAELAEELRGNLDRYMYWNYNKTERPW